LDSRVAACAMVEIRKNTTTAKIFILVSFDFIELTINIVAI
jgi:hypothetical protein